MFETYMPIPGYVELRIGVPGKTSGKELGGLAWVFAALGVVLIIEELGTK